MRKDERYSDYTRILTSIHGYNQSGDVLKQITYDKDEITKSMKGNSFYNMGYCKYFLLRLELLATEHDSLHEFNAHSVEHVLPQKPEPDGYWAKNHNISQINEYVDKIGNLVLLSKGKNSSAKNYDFNKKKEKYLKPRVSDYPRSIQVLEYEEWTRDIIEERTEDAAKIILNDL
jgi:hypothetical protein